MHHLHASHPIYYTAGLAFIQQLMMLSQSEYLEVPFKEANSRSHCSHSDQNSSTEMNPLYKSCGGSAKGSSDPTDLHQQVMKFKEKAHQSFMQVMQMQQLHEDELELIREEYQEKLAQNSERIAELELKVKQLEHDNKTLQRNAQQHVLELSEGDLSLDNIEVIACQDESCLDESVLATFRELVDLRTEEESISELQRSIMGELRRMGGGKGLEQLVKRLFDYVTFIKQEFVGIHEKNLQLQKNNQMIASKDVTGKTSVESLKKENKFMSEHLKRLTKEKIQTEKRAHELTMSVKDLQNKLKKVESAAPRGRREDPLARNRKEAEREGSLDINEFISSNFNRIATQASMPEPRMNLLKRSRH